MRVERARLRARGFSLLELAITLAIVGMLAGALLVPLVSQIASRNIAVTDRALTDIKDALLGFVAANGRLPCPASATSNGLEAFAVGGTSANGNCESFWGFVPARALGVTPIDSNGYAVDGWGASSWNRIRYAVSNAKLTGATNPYTFTSANGIRNATISAVGTANLLYVCSSGLGVIAGANCGAAQTLTSAAPVVIWSAGPNAQTGGTSQDERENPNPNGGSADAIFVSHTVSDVTANSFDDMVSWIGVNTLINKMLAAGALP